MNEYILYAVLTPCMYVSMELRHRHQTCHWSTCLSVSNSRYTNILVTAYFFIVVKGHYGKCRQLHGRAEWKWEQHTSKFKPLIIKCAEQYRLMKQFSLRISFPLKQYSHAQMYNERDIGLCDWSFCSYWLWRNPFLKQFKYETKITVFIPCKHSFSISVDYEASAVRIRHYLYQISALCCLY